MRDDDGEQLCFVDGAVDGFGPPGQTVIQPYQRVFADAYREAVRRGAAPWEAEQEAADAASEFLHPQRALRGAKDI